MHYSFIIFERERERERERKRELRSNNSNMEKPQFFILTLNIYSHELPSMFLTKALAGFVQILASLKAEIP